MFFSLPLDRLRAASSLLFYLCCIQTSAKAHLRGVTSLSLLVTRSLCLLLTNLTQAMACFVLSDFTDWCKLSFLYINVSKTKVITDFRKN